MIFRVSVRVIDITNQFGELVIKVPRRVTDLGAIGKQFIVADHETNLLGYCRYAEYEELHPHAVTFNYPTANIQRQRPDDVQNKIFVNII